MSSRLTRGILLIVLFTVVIVSGFLAVFQTEYANGWDGYYYLVQVQSLNNTGVMHSPEYSLVYLPLMALYTISGDYVVSGKISMIMIKALFVLSIFTLSLSMLRSSGTGRREAFHTALLAAAVSAMSPSMNYFCTQFPKNLLGFALLFFFMACVFATVRHWKDRKTVSSVSLFSGVGGAVLLFLAAFFTHRFSAILLLCFLVLYLAPVAKDLLKRLWSGGSRRQSRWIILSSAVFLLLVLLISSRLPLAPSIHDLERITGDLSLHPIFVPSSFISAFNISRLTPVWNIEIFLAALLPVLTGILLLIRNRFRFLRFRGYGTLVVLSLIGLFPFTRFSLMGLSYRLFFGTMLMLPLVCIPYLRIAVQRLMRVRQDLLKRKTEAVAGLVFLALMAISFYTCRSYRFEVHDPPYAFYDELAGEAAQALSGRNCELIIAHKALAEMITFRYEIDALPWSPEEYFRRDRVWRITAGILRDEISYYLSPEAADSYYIRLSGDYGLLREDYWEVFMQSIANDPVMLEAVNTWRNPQEQRPAYMRKGRL